METKFMTATEAQTKLSEILDWVGSGNQVILTKYGKRIAKITPFTETKSNKQEVLDWLEHNTFKTKKPFDSTKFFRKMRDEEHKSLGL